MRFLEELDQEQRRAVTFGEGPLLVVAGAGSGKTRVLTYRMAWLLASGRAKPHNLLAVTFTNKAAGEMRERVSRLLGQLPPGGFVGTFHRFALGLLRSYPEKVGLKRRFVIADEDEQRRLVEAALSELGVPASQLSPRAARSAISRIKNGSGEDNGELGSLLREVMACYQMKIQQAGAIDFDDMLTLACRLLSEDRALRERLRQQYSYILVDEFQDTNPVQMELLRHLGGPRPNLTAVGDEDQSIYRFRGAELAHILRFEQTYPGACIVTLGNNYRSAEPILKAAASVIAHNRQRRNKVLRSRAPGGEPVTVWAAQDEAHEASLVVTDIQRERAEGTGSIAVLFRINALSRPLEAELVRWGVPYRIVGGMRFWDRAEVRHALAYLRLLVNPNDELAFRRVVNVPARGIGAATLDRLAEVARRRSCSLPEASREGGGELLPRAREALARFWHLVESWRAHDQNALAPLVTRVLEESGLASQYNPHDDEDQARLANLDQLVNAAAEAQQRGLSLAGFLDEVALLADADTETEVGSVLLSTLHAGKGLEFDVVYLIGLEEGLLPLLRDRGDADDEEEERRLMYVGMTRAKRKLVLSYARTRRLHGESHATRPSRFLAELPPELRGAPTHERNFLTAARAAVRERVTTPPGSVQGFAPGVRVEHPTFGRGVVLRLQASGAQTRVVVFFDRVGKKTLIPSIAQLKIC